MDSGKGVGGDCIGHPGFRGTGQAVIQGFFHFADALLDGPVVGGVVGRTVERNDALFGQKLVDPAVVKDAAVVPLEEERQPVFGEEFAEMVGYVEAREIKGEQRFKRKPGREMEFPRKNGQPERS
jgi:hypothetical protein